MTKFIKRTKKHKYAVAFTVDIHIKSFICDYSSITQGYSVVLASTIAVEKLYDYPIYIVNSTINVRALYFRSIISTNSIIKRYTNYAEKWYYNKLMYHDVLCIYDRTMNSIFNKLKLL